MRRRIFPGHWVLSVVQAADEGDNLCGEPPGSSGGSLAAATEGAEGRHGGSMSRFMCAVLSLSLLSPVAAQDKPHSYVPKEGFVPDAATAIRIAEAVWIPIYGEKDIAEQKPFRAILKNGVWTVLGTFNHPPSWSGGVALAEISKATGQILRISHGV
jgi:hypothetical protein